MNILAAVIVQALAVAGTALIAKGLCPRSWRHVRPWSCALCLSAWGGLLVAAAQVVGGILQPEWSAAWIVAWGLRYLGAVAASTWLLGQTSLFMPELPPGLAGPEE